MYQRTRDLDHMYATDAVNYVLTYQARKGKPIKVFSVSGKKFSKLYLSNVRAEEATYGLTNFRCDITATDVNGEKYYIEVINTNDFRKHKNKMNVITEGGFNVLFVNVRDCILGNSKEKIYEAVENLLKYDGLYTL